MRGPPVSIFIVCWQPCCGQRKFSKFVFASNDSISIASLRWTHITRVLLLVIRKLAARFGMVCSSQPLERKSALAELLIEGVLIEGVAQPTIAMVSDRERTGYGIDSAARLIFGILRDAVQ